MKRNPNSNPVETEALHQEGLRRCLDCLAIKPEEAFGRWRQGPYGLRYTCRDCTNQANRKKYYPKITEEARDRKRKKNHLAYHAMAELEKKDHNRKQGLKQNHGLTLEEFDIMLAAQDGRCAICGRDNPTGRFSQWHIDHCHRTGQIRGILCDSCNRGLGMFKDNVEFLQTAIAYLLRWEDAPPRQLIQGSLQRGDQT